MPTSVNATANCSANVNGRGVGLGWSIFETGYQEILDMKPDPRIEHWLFMSSPWPTICLSILYVIIVKGVGPSIMKNRKPLDLRLFLVLYNGVQVIFSAWIFSMAFDRTRWLGTYSFTCEPVDYSLTEHAIATAAGCWWYYFSKFIEFFDTFFFVLRKKDRHITFLHAFHHGMMPIASWVIVKYVPGGHSTFGGMLNAFVHILMYTYYMIAAMGPNYQKFIWWKKYLTTIQMIQFTFVALHSGQLFFTPCNYPKIFALFLLINSIIFLSLFTNFYTKSYKKIKKL